MKAKTLFMVATLMAMAQGAWAQTTVKTDQELRAAIQINNVDIKLLADLNLSNSTLNMQGKNTITDNQGNGNTCNVYLSEGAVITVTGSLEGSKIGISMQTPDILTSGWSTYNQDVVPATIFVSDNADYEIASSDGECLLKKKMGTGIQEMKDEELIMKNDGIWYDLGGRKLGGKPSRAGVYI